MMVLSLNFVIFAGSVPVTLPLILKMLPLLTWVVFLLCVAPSVIRLLILLMGFSLSLFLSNTITLVTPNVTSNRRASHF